MDKRRMIETRRSSDVQSVIVDTTHGPVRGSVRAGVSSFLGVPYARPPIGPLRFRRPVAPDSWTEPRDATRAGPDAPQSIREASDGNAQSEADALHLTVHTPGLTGKRPVFVWIHGGSFTSGSSAWDRYDTTSFARDGLVAVSFNYRLGAFGFADLTAHFGHDLAVNAALGDALLALTWIRDNIARFGGDPDRITIAGQSAGAGMVSALLASPLGRGLFHRAVLQSGANFVLQSPAVSAVIAENLLHLIGVQPGDLAALERVSTQRLLEASEQSSALLRGVEPLYLAWNLHRDADTLPLSLDEQLRTGDLAGIDILLGTTSDENKLRWLASAPDGEDEGVDPRLPPDFVRKARDLYRNEARGSTEWEISEAIGSDQSYLAPTTQVAVEHARHGGRAYLYLFSWRSPVLDGRLGACHAMENAFVFDRLNRPEFHGDRAPQDLADAMHDSWATFAATGDPHLDQMPPWPPVGEGALPTMEFDVERRLRNDPRSRERAVWQSVPAGLLGVG